MCLSRTMSNDMGVLTLHPIPCVGDWYMHLLSDMESVNDINMDMRGSIASIEHRWMNVQDALII